MSQSYNRICQWLPQWGECEAVRTLSGGNRNVAVLVRRGAELLVAKTTSRGSESIKWVAEVHSLAQEIGLDVPAFIPTENGLLEVRGVTLERWIEGVPASKDDRLRTLGLLRALHENTIGWRQRPGFHSSLALLEESKGGDIDLTEMPEHVLSICRESWKTIRSEPQSVIHGDLSRENVLTTRDGRVALIDWDEARVDVSLLDVVGLLDENPGYATGKWLNARRALDAWEIAVSWQREPEYARARLSRILEQATPPADV